MLQELSWEALTILKDNNYSNEMALSYSKTALYIKLNNVYARGHFIFFLVDVLFSQNKIIDNAHNTHYNIDK